MSGTHQGSSPWHPRFNNQVTLGDTVANQGMFPTPHVYVASSWRNQFQPNVVQALRAAGYAVYDFKNPNGEKGFAWSDIVDDNHDSVSTTEYLDIIAHPLADKGFQRDMNALFASDIVVLVLPCERDAHLELGWAVGAGKQTHILLDNPCKASLMYKMVDFIHPTLEDLLVTLGDADA
ncbi:hypothetical protein SEND513_79 [Mycobacterium phage Send513]|uniref:Nucleoside deoxyribosyltransferase n=4 Tax=Papyrusvirus send513 TaxID=1982556 RepID=G1BRQ7_9CAUD|nr:nucleoside deoxyribosyltransferase [Mycobacterium phage Send513]AEK07523.1 hypothetical protein SEND513_79 [Mycobacterium phage Send513]AYQ98653.1 hypothetical protein SEA_RIPARIAN_81 [Mycobacterium phage Riparian]